MDIGSAIRAARKGCGLSQEQLADIAGVSRSAIVALESNRGACRTLIAVRPHIGFRITGLANGNDPAEQVRNARRNKGLSLARVSEGSGVSIPTVRSIEAGKGNISSLSAIIAFLAPKARPNGWYRAHWQVNKDVRFTPPELLKAIVEVVGKISLDPAGDPRSFVSAKRTITEAEDGLSVPWSGKLAFVNPPFSDLSRWMHRCCDAWDANEIEQMLALFPARTETVAYRTRIFGTADTLFLPRRLRFYADDHEQLPPSPFALMMCAWGIDRAVVQALADRLEANVVWGSPA